MDGGEVWLADGATWAVSWDGSPDINPDAAWLAIYRLGCDRNVLLDPGEYGFDPLLGSAWVKHIDETDPGCSADVTWTADAPPGPGGGLFVETPGPTAAYGMAGVWIRRPAAANGTASGIDVQVGSHAAAIGLGTGFCASTYISGECILEWRQPIPTVASSGALSGRKPL